MAACSSPMYTNCQELRGFPDLPDFTASRHCIVSSDPLALPIPAMKHRLSSLAFARTSTAPRVLHTPLLSSISARSTVQCAASRPLQRRCFAITARQNVKLPSKDAGSYENSNARPASELNNNITQEEKDDFARKLQEDKGKQIRTPWHREGSDKPPVARQRSAGAMTKGMLPLITAKPPANIC